MHRGLRTAPPRREGRGGAPAGVGAVRAGVLAGAGSVVATGEDGELRTAAARGGWDALREALRLEVGPWRLPVSASTSSSSPSPPLTPPVTESVSASDLPS